MLARKNNIQPNRTSRSVVFNEKIRLQQERNLALKREDFQEAEAIDAKLKALEEAVERRISKAVYSHADHRRTSSKVGERVGKHTLLPVVMSHREAGV